MWGKGHQVKSCLGQQIGQGQPWLSSDYKLLLSDRNILCPKLLLFRDTDRPKGWPVVLIYNNKHKVMKWGDTMFVPDNIYIFLYIMYYFNSYLANKS